MNYEFLFYRLRNVRENNNLTQKEVADKLNISRPNYTRWETKEKIIPLRKLNAFCNLFNVSMDYIVGLSNTNSKISYDKELDLEVVSERLKRVRKQLNLTQQNLADFLQCDRSIISDYENGITLILTSFAIQICNKYNISLDWLCGRK